MHNRESKESIRTAKGFALSLLLHLSILLLFWTSSEKFFSSPPKAEKKITLDLSKFVSPPPTPKPQMKPVPPPQPVTPPQPKPKPKPKKIVKEKPQPKKKVLQEKKTLTAQKAPEDNNITKVAKKPEKKIVKKEGKKPKKKIVKKKIIKKTPPKKPKKRVAQKRPRPKQYNSSLANSLMGSKQARPIQTRPSRSSAASPAAKRMIKQLYGSEFNGYSSEQKKFIENNLIIIHRITQMTLNRNGYPELAARTGQEGTNIVSFYLHPNGNISNLRLDKHMGHEALDRNTLQVIRIAYKDYPLPRKKTKIKFFVQYSIDGY